jgi:PTH1 family peptidyl-tRNA hydrolase
VEEQLVIVGLGNPGKKYELSRHNMGYFVVQEFAHQHRWQLKEDSQFPAYVVKDRIQEKMVHLVLPTTYMNESGRAVKRYLDFYKLTPSGLIVIADDVALPYGDMRLRSKGSAGGHNGMKSIVAHIGTSDFARLRMGIGMKQDHRTLADYVLDNFTKEEMASLLGIVQRGVEVLNRLMHETIAHVMGTVNTKIKQNISPQVEGQENNA